MSESKPGGGKARKEGKEPLPSVVRQLIEVIIGNWCLRGPVDPGGLIPPCGQAVYSISFLEKGDSP